MAHVAHLCSARGWDTRPELFKMVDGSAATFYKQRLGDKLSTLDSTSGCEVSRQKKDDLNKCLLDFAQQCWRQSMFALDNRFQLLPMKRFITWHFALRRGISLGERNASVINSIPRGTHGNATSQLHIGKMLVRRFGPPNIEVWVARSVGDGNVVLHATEVIAKWNGLWHVYKGGHHRAQHQVRKDNGYTRKWQGEVRGRHAVLKARSEATHALIDLGAENSDTCLLGGTLAELKSGEVSIGAMWGTEHEDTLDVFQTYRAKPRFADNMVDTRVRYNRDVQMKKAAIYFASNSHTLTSHMRKQRFLGYDPSQERRVYFFRILAFYLGAPFRRAAAWFECDIVLVLASHFLNNSHATHNREIVAVLVAVATLGLRVGTRMYMDALLMCDPGALLKKELASLPPSVNFEGLPRRCELDIYISDSLRARHISTMQILAAACALPNSKWTLFSISDLMEQDVVGVYAAP